MKSLHTAEHSKDGRLQQFFICLSTIATVSLSVIIVCSSSLLLLVPREGCVFVTVILLRLRSV